MAWRGFGAVDGSGTASRVCVRIRFRRPGRSAVSAEQWYYDIAEGRAVQGKVTNWDNRMGPYDTRGEAEAALAKAKARNEAWDAEDEKD